MYSIIQAPYYIVSELNGYAFTVSDDKSRSVTLQTNTKATNQQWGILPSNSPDTITIVSLRSGFVLDGGDMTQNTTLVVSSLKDGKLSQLWKRDGNYLVSLSTNPSGLVMDVKRGNVSPGTPIILWTKNSPTSSNQQFDFVVRLFWSFKKEESEGKIIKLIGVSYSWHVSMYI